MDRGRKGRKGGRQKGRKRGTTGWEGADEVGRSNSSAVGRRSSASLFLSPSREEHEDKRENGKDSPKSYCKEGEELAGGQLAEDEETAGRPARRTS